MSKRMFSEGDLVRKCTESGTPIGPWLKILVANAYQVRVQCAECLPTPNMLEQTLDKKHVWKPKVIQLAISEAMIQKIKEGQAVVSHSDSPQWLKLYNGKYDIVKLYTINGWYRLHCTISDVRTCSTLSGVRIVLVIDRVIC